MGSAAPVPSVASASQEAYFQRLETEAHRVLEAARAARAQGMDPSLHVEIPLAADLAARVEEQVQIRGIADRVRALTREHPSRELVAIHVAREVAAGKLGAFPNREAAVEKAVRAGLSVLTEGVLVAPLEGIAKVQLGQNHDGTDYVDLYFAGPIRAAGGTAQGLSVLIADVVRRDLGIERYQPTPAELERYKEEVPAYKRAQHLQYAPGPEEIELIVKHCPICINGEGTEQEEVTGHRDLPRVEGNRLRGGAVLVLAEGLTLKAPKLAKIVSTLNIPDWGFLETLARKTPQKAEPSDDSEIHASDKFIKELIAGRPVLAHPSRIGAFRLRYGRARTAGLASTAISPLMMAAVDDFLAIGTQLKIERPGKGTIATPCDALEGPILLLRNGDLVQPQTLDEFQAVRSHIAQITDLGEILIPFGEFYENNALLPDASFSPEWWQLELEAGAKKRGQPTPRVPAEPTFEEARALSHQFSIPLHPAHNLFWHDLSWDAYRHLAAAAAAAQRTDAGLRLPKHPATKDALVQLGALHRETPDEYVLTQRVDALLTGLGATPGTPNPDLPALPPNGRWPALAEAARRTGVPIRPRAPTRIGARMGRPEKADLRTMSPPVHVLFPVGHEGGTQRNLEEAAQKPSIRVPVGIRRCGTCGREAVTIRCQCGARTEPTGAPPAERTIVIKDEMRRALERLGGMKPPKRLKGVQGLVSADKTPEPIEKGILRVLHEVWVFKDGTIRFDATDAPLTHFRPREVGTRVERLRALGYETDYLGQPLIRDDQLVELRVQDVILPKTAGQYFIQVARYMDDLLQRLYGLPAFYQVTDASGLVGHLVAGLAPHTSGAVLGRIVGFTRANVAYAHPFFHSSKRRNADGDEDAFMLLLDAFVNFSRAFIPDRRGGLMDLPLVLATRIDPREIDKEAHNLDVGTRYPLDLYYAAEAHEPAKAVAAKIDLVAHRLGTPAQYEGFGFTLDTTAVDAGPVDSAYKTLGTMPEKMAAQLRLAERIRAVDASDVAARVITHHLLPDLIGNLKAFARQSVRCTKCNAKYRRMPLAGTCVRVLANGRDACGNALTLTVHPASVRKYLDLCLELAEKYGIPEYTKQHIHLVEQFIHETFRVREMKLAAFT